MSFEFLPKVEKTYEMIEENNSVDWSSTYLSGRELQLGDKILPSIFSSARALPIDDGCYESSVCGRREAASTDAVEQPLDQKKEIATLIEELKHKDYRKRTDAEHKLVLIGAAALPQLLDASISSNPEQSRRAQMTAGKIISALPPDQIASLRDPIQRERLIDTGAANNLDADHKKQLNDDILNLANRALALKLGWPSWMTDLAADGNLFFEKASERTVAEWDRMETPEGKNKVKQHIEMLNRTILSGTLTKSEIQAIESQLVDLASMQNPEGIRSHRFSSRLALAGNLDIKTDRERVRELLLQAHALRPREKNSDFQHKILAIGMDSDNEFMLKLEKMAGAEMVDEIRYLRKRYY